MYVIYNAYATFYLSIHQVMNIWGVNTFWLIWKMLLINIYTQVFVWPYVFSSLGYIPRSGIAGSYDNFVFIFWGILKLFQSDCTILHSQQQHIRLQFRPHLINICYCLLYFCHSGEVVSHCDSEDYWCWASSHMPIGHLNIFFGEMSVQILCPFLNWVICLSIVELWELFIFSIDFF